jgi:hypothetical protein
MYIDKDAPVFTHSFFEDGEYDVKWLVTKHIAGYQMQVNGDEYGWHIHGGSLDVSERDLAFKNATVYFCMDMNFNDAFAHWFYESFIFINYVLKCKETYPNTRILCRTRRTYKLTFPAHFGIEVEYGVSDRNNLAFFPEFVSYSNDVQCSEKYKKLVEQLYAKFAYAPAYAPDKAIPITFLPRQSRENHHGRQYDCSTIVEYVQQCKDNMILQTDMLSSLQEQLQTLQTSKVIILTEGSPYLVNGLFATDSTIIVLGDIVERQAEAYKKFRFISDFIAKHNKVNCVKSTRFNSFGQFDSGFHIDQILEFL